jgi:hypothetical protein
MYIKKKKPVHSMGSKLILFYHQVFKLVFCRRMLLCVSLQFFFFNFFFFFFCVIYIFISNQDILCTHGVYKRSYVTSKSKKNKKLMKSNHHFGLYIMFFFLDK